MFLVLRCICIFVSSIFAQVSKYHYILIKLCFHENEDWEFGVNQYLNNFPFEAIEQ